MSTSAAELMKKAAELRQNGSTAPSHSAAAQGAKFPRTSVPVGQEGTFERLLRFSLYNQNSLENLQRGANLVIILHDEGLKSNMLEQVKFWEQSRPTVSQEERLKGIYKEHPLGEKKVYLLIALISAVEKVAQLQNHKYVSSWQALEAYDTAELTASIGMFNARFPTPRDGRPWVWELTIGGVSSDQFRANLRTLLVESASFSATAKVIRVETARKGQTELKRALWEDFRSMQGSMNQ